MATGEALTLVDFRPGVDDIEAIGQTEGEQGVLAEIRAAFGVDADSDPKTVIGAVAPHKDLQDNIAHGVEVLSRPGVQTHLGYPEGTSPFRIARDWCQRSGLQVAVARPLLRPGELAGQFDAVVLPDRVTNWVQRMGTVVLEHVVDGVEMDRVVAVSSLRRVGEDESPDYDPGTPSNVVMFDAVRRLRDRELFGSVELLYVDSGKGSDVMYAAARHLSEHLDLTTAKVLLPAVAGNWLQTGVQARAAFRQANPEFDIDRENPQLYVVSDSFPLGVTGQEPKITHQNPMSGLGNLVRVFGLANSVRT